MDNKFKDFLMELYLKYGERDFVYIYTGEKMEEYLDNRHPVRLITDKHGKLRAASYITPKAIKLIKDNK